MWIPCGSTSLAIFNASELARSVFAGDIARIKHESFPMNSISMFRICTSISGGWSPTGTFVIPGRSINVRFNTVNLKFKYESNMMNKFKETKWFIKKDLEIMLDRDQRPIIDYFELTSLNLISVFIIHYAEYGQNQQVWLWKLGKSEENDNILWWLFQVFNNLIVNVRHSINKINEWPHMVCQD